MTTPKTITMANLRRSGGDAFMDVATNRTRYVVTSHRRPLVAVVPLEDLERLEAGDVDDRPRSTAVKFTPRQMMRLDAAGWVGGEMGMAEWLTRRSEALTTAVSPFGSGQQQGIEAAISGIDGATCGEWTEEAASGWTDRLHPTRTRTATTALR